MKRLMILAVVSIFLLTGAISQAVAAPLVFRFAGQSPPEHQTTQHMNMIAKEIKEGTNGRVEIKVYPASQLGNFTVIFEELMRGTIDMQLGGIAMEFEPRLGIVYVCGYTNDYETIKKIYAPGAWLPEKLNDISLPIGVRMLGPYVEGMMGTGSIKPLVEPLNPKVDKGVLARVPTMETYVLAAKAMGFRSVTIPWPDTYQALQTGVCDAVIGYPTASAYQMLGDVIKYWYATNYSMEFVPFMMSEKSWVKLSDEDKKVFKRVINKYASLSLDNAKLEDEKYMKLMEKKGIKVYRYTEEELKPVQQACVSTWKELGQGSLGKDLMEGFEKYLRSLQ